MKVILNNIHIVIISAVVGISSWLYFILDKNIMAPQYKLTYFNGRGLAEPIRLAFSYLDIPYEDVRISHDQWADLKKTTPYGKLPMLEVDGKVMSQSKAILRYLARKHNLTGNNEWDAAQCDVVVDTLNDLLLEISQWKSTEDVEKKKVLETKFKTESIPTYLKNFEKAVIQNGGHLVASKFTWADIYVICMVDTIGSHLKEELFDSFPELKKLKEKLYNTPSIAAWLAKRPVTEF